MKENKINKTRDKKLKPWKVNKTKKTVVKHSPKPADPKVLQELRYIYDKYVPGKTSEEVDAIIQKFAGRENLLLLKVRNKYVKTADNVNADVADAIITKNKKSPVPPSKQSTAVAKNESPLVKSRSLV